MPEYRAFVSDIHLSATVGEQSPQPWEWLSAQQRTEVETLLCHLANWDDCREVVLLGDVFDTWVFPHDIVPSSVSEILAAPQNQAFVAALTQLAAKKRVVYLPGNHDMHTQSCDLTNVPGLASIVYGGSGLQDPRFVSGRLRAEHGSAHTFFCAPDPLRRGRLPLGFFISRVMASAQAYQGREYRRLWAFVDNLFEALGPESFAAAVFEALLEEAGLAGSGVIKMPAWLWGGEDVTARQVRDLYRNLYAESVARNGLGKTLRSIMAELKQLDPVADSICSKGGTNVVIFGHSHRAELDRDRFLVDDRIYANSGTVKDQGRPATFVVTHKLTEPSGRRVQRVAVYEWQASNQQAVVYRDWAEVSV